jgi:hypothetical protein
MIKRHLIGALMATMLLTSVIAQSHVNENAVTMSTGAVQDCELNLIRMEDMATRAIEQTKDGSLLIVVAHLGNDETRPDLNRRRLYNVREFLKNTGKFDTKKLVVAEGEPVSGPGQIEFYLGGKLVNTFSLLRNKDFCLSCCTEDGPYYPHKDNTDRKPKKPARTP